MKRFILIWMFLAFSIVLMSCQEVYDPQRWLEQFESSILNENESFVNITSDLNFPLKTTNDTSIEYISSHPDIIDSFGKVKQPILESVTVEVKVIIDYEFPVELNYIFIVLPKIFKMQLIVSYESFENISEVFEYEGLFFNTIPMIKSYLSFGLRLLYYKDENDVQYTTINEIITRDITLYAVFETIIYFVEFYDDSNKRIKTIQIRHSETIFDFPRLEKPGYEFIGWIYTNSANHDVLLVENQTIIQENINAYPLWIKN